MQNVLFGNFLSNFIPLQILIYTGVCLVDFNYNLTLLLTCMSDITLSMLFQILRRLPVAFYATGPLSQTKQNLASVS